MGINPVSFFDCISVSLKLCKLIGNATISEINMFSYLACLLSLYEGKPVSDWGYSFAATSQGVPYSVDIQESIDIATSNAILVQENDLFTIGPVIDSNFRHLLKINSNKAREKYLNGSCSSLLIIPLNFIRYSILLEPEINIARTLGQGKHLLSKVDLRIIYDQFEAIKHLMNSEDIDLIAPAVTWINYLHRVSIQAPCENQL